MAIIDTANLQTAQNFSSSMWEYVVAVKGDFILMNYE